MLVEEYNIDNVPTSERTKLRELWQGKQHKAAQALLVQHKALLIEGCSLCGNNPQEKYMEWMRYIFAPQSKWANGNNIYD